MFTVGESGRGAMRRDACIWICIHYFLRQRPTVGDEPHFGPSAEPPLGQNTDTNVSLASQLT
jgi:hypothetical protein